MADYGVTSSGFVKKTKDEIVEDLEDEFLSVFGQDLDVDIESPEGQIINIIAEIAEDLWELAEEAYNAFNPSATADILLDNIVKINNLTRNAATATTATVTFYGEEDTYIPEGTIVSTPELTDGTESITFTTDSDGAIDATGELELAVTCTETGAIEIIAGRISQLDDAITGVDSVSNVDEGNTGSDEETDVELRARRIQEVAFSATSTVDSLEAGIIDIDTVSSVSVFENDTGTSATVSGITIDPHSLAIYVQGDESDDENASVAEAIFDRKDAGVPLQGDVSYDVTDSQGYTHTIYWNRPTEIPIYITVNTNGVAGEIDSEGSDIVTAIMDYIESSTTVGTIGEDVYFGQFFTPVNSVSGHNVQSIYIDTSASPTSMADISINGDEIATFYEDYITVNVSYT